MAYRTKKPNPNNWQPMNRARFSSGGVLQNELIPTHLDRMMWAIDLIEIKEKEAIGHLISSLKKLLPFFSTLFPNFDKLWNRLMQCVQLKNNWKKRHYTLWPDALEYELLMLYKDFLLAYNKCGIGLEYEPYRDLEKERYNAIVGNT